RRPSCARRRGQQLCYSILRQAQNSYARCRGQQLQHSSVLRKVQLAGT
ncbi:hypothetical protein A2U01_0084109, partial [Trifolium medium]|nr:hypothetical protein [Trifolium medium]